MPYNVGDVINKYIELRDRKAELAKRHDEEMQQFSGPMQAIENYLMHQMNELGVSQLKEAGVGTAFKVNSTSVQMKEPAEFKAFVFEPAVLALINHLTVQGIHVDEHLAATVASILRDLPRWDVVDFRAGKKGIQEYQENSERAVPGVAVNSVLTISIRRA